MKAKINARAGVAASALILLVTSGCSGKEQGYAQPQGSSNGSSIDIQTTVPAPSNPISSSLEPCDLLSAKDLAEAGKFKTKYKEQGGARSCYWQSDFEQGGDGFTFAVSLRDAQSVDTLNDLGAGVQRTEVNQRPAAVSKNAEFRSYTVAMKLDDVSRVDVSVPRTEEDDACEIAEVIAGLVEPHLPEIP